MTILNKKIKGICFFGLLVLCSCGDNNQIYYDLHKESIISCSGAALSSINITNNNNLESYSFQIKNWELEADTFYLFKKNFNYILKRYGIIMPINDFQILPNSNYTVTNYSNGDAASIEIEFRTNTAGKIIYASKTTCK